MGPIGGSARSARSRSPTWGFGIAVVLLLAFTGAAGPPEDRAAGRDLQAASAASFVANASYLVGAGSWNCGQGHQTIDFFGSVQGGTPPYEYNWTFGDGTNISQVQDPAHTYTAPGSFVVNLTVRDGANEVARASVSPIWGIPLVCGGQPTPVSPMAAILFVALVGVVVVAGAVVVRWRRPPGARP